MCRDIDNVAVHGRWLLTTGSTKAGTAVLIFWSSIQFVFGNMNIIKSHFDLSVLSSITNIIHVT